MGFILQSGAAWTNSFIRVMRVDHKYKYKFHHSAWPTKAALPLPITSDVTGLAPVCLLNGQEERVDVAERVNLGIGSTCSSFIVGSLSRIFTSGGSSAISRSYHQPHPKA